MKKIVLPLALLLAALAGIAFWLHENADGLIRTAIVKYGSAMTRAAVAVEAVEIAAADGRGQVRGLSIANPAGFKTDHAFKVARIDVAVDLSTLASDVVVIRRIEIVAPDVVYEKGDAMTNFDALQKNIADYLGKTEKTQGGKKLIVGEIVLRDARAQASAGFMNGKTVAVPLPDIVLRDVGKAAGGVTPGELGQEIVKALRAKLSAAVSFDSLSQSLGQGLDKAGSAIKGLFK